MHPTARRCVQWAIGLFLVGATTEVFAARLISAIGPALGSSLNEVATAVAFTITLARWTTMPVGASLVGAAVVINTLAPRNRREAEEERLRNSNRRD